MPDVSLHLVASFNAEVLARYVRARTTEDTTVTVAPFAQPYQELLRDAGPDEPLHDVGVVWTLPEAVIEPFARAAAFEEVPTDEVLDAVDAYAATLRTYARRVRFLLVPTWTRPAGHRGYGMLDWRPGVGLGQLLARMNLRLSESLADLDDVAVLDAERWLRGRGADDPSGAKLWFAAKVPFPGAVFELAADDVIAALAGAAGRARKLVVVDLDGTLWGGVVGDVGPQGVRLGGHDHVGEAYAEFQRALKALTRRGVQLAIASKNDEAVALAVIDDHPEMRLRRDDFAGWRIDWNDKAANIAAVARDLSLGLDAVVFLDDNPRERARVRESLPDVLVPEWPADPTRYAAALRALEVFDTPALTAEDRARTRQYASRRERAASQAAVSSVDAWLQSLDMTVTCHPLRDADRDRVVQLLNKTNQFNLTTRRLSAEELQRWLGPGRDLLTFRVADRFGDEGLTGLVSVEIQGADATVVDLVMSCRVMGRGVEGAMLHVAAEHARRAGATRLSLTHQPTERNAPTLEALRRAALEDLGDGRFAWPTDRRYPLPAHVTLEASGVLPVPT